MGAIKDVFRKAAILIAAGGLLAVSTPENSRAENYAAAQSYVHSFNNNVTVWTELFALNKDLNLDTSTYFRYTIDMINPSFGGGGEGGEKGERGAGNVRGVAAATGASSATSSNSGKASDTRHELLGSFTHEFKNVAGVEASFDYSTERDYDSKTPSISLKKDLFDKNTTLTFGFSKNFDSISGTHMEGVQYRSSDNYFAGITQLISPITMAQIGYSRSNSYGFMAEGVRLVPINGETAANCGIKGGKCVYEEFPGKRSRNGYIASISHYLGGQPLDFLSRSSVKLQYRYYDDSWGIKSNTAEAEWNKYLSSEWLMRLNYRYYQQTKAFFDKVSVTGADVFKSASPQLKGFSTNLGGLKLAYLFKKSPDFSWIQGGSLEGKYEYYTESISVNAHVFMVGLRLLL